MKTRADSYSSFTSLDDTIGDCVELRLPTMVRPSIQLTEKIVKDISNSINIFKPSKSLHDIVVDNPYAIDSNPVAEIDLVISGGGLKAYYMSGCLMVLQNQLARHNINIVRVAGASAGAWSALFICAGIPLSVIIESYYRTLEQPHKFLHEVYEQDLWPMMTDIIPENAYQLCTGRLFISITVITATGLKNMMISEFHSNAELLEACCASSTIPYITERNWCRYFRGSPVMDGGLTNNTPIFQDRLRRQLVFTLSMIEYPWKLLINAQDTCIDALVIRGAMQMSSFLEGEAVPAMSWLEKTQPESEIYTPGHYIRRVIAPFVVSSVVFIRSTGLSSVIEFAEVMLALGHVITPSTGVIDFRDSQTYFGENNAFMYVVGVMYAVALGLARKMHLLL